MKRLSLVIAILCVTICSSFASSEAQSGVVSGSVSDAVNSEVLIGATVFVENNPGLGSITDIDGLYELSLSPGTYNLVFKFISYNTKVIEGVVVQSGAVTQLNVTLESGATQLQDVVVRATLAKENVNALLTLQKNSTTISDGISADLIRKTPDRNTSDALRRVSGVTIQNNKFAIIRGLSDRYNNALINGTPLPSTEVDRRTFSFDLIPSALLDNIIVLKTAQPDMPGDFAGGIIRVNTKDIPEENFISLGGSLGYNANTTFKDWYSSQKGGTDWLGYDDGTRKLPDAFPGTEEVQSSTQLALASSNLFPNDWNYFQSNSPMNYSLQFTGGLKKDLFGKDFGAILSLSYNADYRYLNSTRADYNFDTSAVYRYYDDGYKYNVLLGGLLNLAYKLNDKNKITLKNSYSTNADNLTTLRNGSYYERTYYVQNYAYYYVENHFLNSQIEGNHFIKPGKMKLDWNAGYARVTRDEPDYRKLFYTKNFDAPEEDPFLAQIPFGSASPDLSGRFYSSLGENIYSASLDLTLPFQFIQRNSLVKFGTYQHWRDREFSARVLGYVVNNINLFFSENQDPNAILASPPATLLSDEHIGPAGFRIDEITNPSDAYSAQSDLHAYYVMLDNKLPARFRVVWGARIEVYNQYLQSAYPNNNPVEVESKANDSIFKLPFDLLPSINLVYAISEKSNLRLSASKTVSRPEFRELAPFSFYDFNTSTSVTGNPELRRTNILNLDARMETFWGKGQVVSGSFFYKEFTNPIEQIVDLGSGAGSRIRTYENVTIARNYGAEFEFRKNFEFMSGISNWNQWQNLSVSTNLAYIRSIVDFAGVANVADSTRPLQGQSPYIVNAGLQYNEPNTDFSASVFFNMIGRRIDAVGSVGYLDIYEAPRPLVDVQVAKRVLKDGNVKLTIADLLSSDAVFYQDQNDDGKYTKEADTQILRIVPGTRFTLSFSYKFN